MTLVDLASGASPVEPEALYQLLVDRIRQMGSVLVAYSGGTDSSLVLAAAHDALGSKALAVTACSLTYPDHEKNQAVALAKQLDARHLLIDSHEIDDAAYCANPPNRCYYCKRELLTQLQAIADREGLALLVDGSNKDDQKDYRPGRQAIAEHKVRSPLAELGMGKAQIRQMAKARGLPNWDSRPAPAWRRAFPTASRSHPRAWIASPKPRLPSAILGFAWCAFAIMATWPGSNWQKTTSIAPCSPAPGNFCSRPASSKDTPMSAWTWKATAPVR
jgi:uncharacterized protein (TIGR00268 family)